MDRVAHVDKSPLILCHCVVNGKGTIFVVDDDPAVRDGLTILLEVKGFSVEAFGSADEFLEKFLPVAQSCAIVEVKMPGMDGMKLQAHLTKLGLALPIIFLTGHGDIPMAVLAIQRGAVDFLTKPFIASELLESIRIALQTSDRLTSQAEVHDGAAARLTLLTKREREVMRLAVDGLHNKDIAHRLGISHRTVEIHKAKVMVKTSAVNLLDLARIAEEGGSRRKLWAPTALPGNSAY